MRGGEWISIGFSKGWFDSLRTEHAGLLLSVVVLVLALLVVWKLSE